LQKLSHIAAIITTTDFFEANQTAYAVLDIFDGITLRELLTLKGGEFDYAQCLTLVNPLIDAVSAIHAVNLIHRGISPDTIYVNRNGDIKLSGFATSSVRTKGTEVASKLFSGYSAPEQYTTSMFQSQATDVYAVAATLYRCLTGATPQDAEQRRSYDTLEAPDKLRTNIPRFISNAVMHALLVNSKERTQTMLEFKKLLNDEHSKLAPVIPAETDEYNSDEYREETTAEAEKRAPIKDKKYFIARLAAIISASFLVVMAVVFIVSNVLGSKKEPISEKPVATDSFKVPSFVGKTLDELKYDTINFKIEIQPTYDPDAKDNEVVSQSPQANTTAKKGASITIYYNHEIIIDSMIDLKGLYVMNAEQLLKSRGIKYTAQEKATSSYPPGTVFEQSVEPGKKFNVNEDKLTIYIAKKSG
ncbi:MAG: PASTA domain-containing protein, partial [Oscillospiraceae bacterium]